MKIETGVSVHDLLMSILKKNQLDILTSGVLQRFGGGATRNLPATLQALLNFHTFFLSQKNVCMRNKFLLSAEDLPTSQV